jgi:hypothetical protein
MPTAQLLKLNFDEVRRRSIKVWRAIRRNRAIGILWIGALALLLASRVELVAIQP